MQGVGRFSKTSERSRARGKNNRGVNLGVSTLIAADLSCVRRLSRQ